MRLTHIVRDAYCNWSSCDVVGCWLLVGHVRELWLNSASEAYGYDLTLIENPIYSRNGVIFSDLEWP